jgi:hypothetical protein
VPVVEIFHDWLPERSRSGCRSLFLARTGGCALQITGLNTGWRRPRYVFGIDGLQALHLAMKCAGAVLEAATPELGWLGEKGDLGMPKFLPDPPKPQQTGSKRSWNARRPSSGAVLGALPRLRLRGAGHGRNLFRDSSIQRRKRDYGPDGRQFEPHRTLAQAT